MADAATGICTLMSAKRVKAGAAAIACAAGQLMAELSGWAIHSGNAGVTHSCNLELDG